VPAVCRPIIILYFAPAEGADVHKLVAAAGSADFAEAERISEGPRQSICPGSDPHMSKALISRVLLTVAVALVATACGSSPSSPTPTNVPYSQTDLQVGTGAAATNGHLVTVNYSLWLYSETAVDHHGAFKQANNGFPFVLGTGAVISGWDRGVPGMKVGGIRRLILPPDLAYGAQGSSDGSIPPNSTLVFEVELTGVQ
jgi:FKBP-type peptidyl-prolyl cis-trans isomerase FkpA